MVVTTPIRASNPFQKIIPELEKDEQAKKNILLLLLILIGVNGSDLLEREVQSSSSTIEALKAKLERKQNLIDRLNDRLKDISEQYDQLNKAGQKLESLTESQRQDYFMKSQKLQDTFELAQIDAQLQMKDASMIMQEIVKAAKVDTAPLKEVVEALQNMGSKLVGLLESQWGNNIRLSK